ncbi:SMP-30/gluconolactonase/LRE family protein [Chitinophaga sp. MM2321]|uniref:SMP-30/gluconolactonase/LRE family protein n=1 Tax=Chitinophaga sp. MM2321 TaxID=3137178 RepID=UPI0032D5809E
MKRFHDMQIIKQVYAGIFFCLIYALQPVQGQQPNAGIIADNATPQLVSSQFSFTEGPASDKKGNIYFTDQPNNKIWKYDTDGKLSVFMDPAGRSNGLYFDRKGNMLACADEKDELWSITPKGKVTVLVNNFEGHRLNGPNDVWISPAGNIYFTDPYYQRAYWDRQKPDIEAQQVYYLPKGKKKPLLAAGDLTKPNGIIGTRDGKWLYVADIGADKTYRYKINKDGTLSDKQLFISKGGDGMTLDNLGNLYLCGNGVLVYDKTGKEIEHIAIPEKWTANICFGGKDNNLLFITASTAIYTLQMKVKGD